MSKIPPHIVDQILQTARIEEVIGEFVQLKRAGSNLKGLSPFTDEKTPSFVVSPAKQIFKCFSTGKGGNAASFLMEKEHFSYPEALRWLAKRYNIEVPEEREATAEELHCPVLLEGYEPPSDPRRDCRISGAGAGRLRDDGRYRCGTSRSALLCRLRRCHG